MADFWVPHEIECWIFQQMLDLEFSETSQNFSSFTYTTFFFIVSKGDQRKNAEKPVYSFGNFSAFLLWSPLGNYEKKSCLNEFNFWEASRNQAYAENFSILTQKMANPPLNLSLHFLIGIPFWLEILKDSDENSGYNFWRVHIRIFEEFMKEFWLEFWIILIPRPRECEIHLLFYCHRFYWLIKILEEFYKNSVKFKITEFRMVYNIYGIGFNYYHFSEKVYEL